jgi:trehalose 6-phosphate synthase
MVGQDRALLGDHDCALVLSREAGAAAELADDAIMVNPFDVAATAAALYEALIMPDSERKRRCQSLVAKAGAVPPTAWFASQLAALDALDAS